MQQAILNLLENSLSAVDSSGLIEISTHQRENRCYLEVADNGPGIPNDEKSRVFDIYFTTKPAGTGMGLPTVLRIIKEHGGRVELLDSPIGGALFRLELPIE
jgi:signal transduction histidine kinase